MSSLTPKQEKFAQCVADGMTQADAYRTAYDCKPTTKPETIINKASELMRNGDIAARVNDLRGQLVKKSLWTREMSVKALIAAYKEGNASVKVSAVKELNSMHGFNAPSKIELNGSVSGIHVSFVDPASK